MRATKNIKIILKCFILGNLWIKTNHYQKKTLNLQLQKHLTENMKNLNDKYGLIANYYSEHYNELKAYVDKHTQFAGEAEDIVQTVFLRLLTTKAMITPVTMPSLVYTVARNLVFDYWRHRKSVEQFEHHIILTGADGIVDMQSVYSANEISEILERGIVRLSDKQRHIFRMNIHDGMKVGEISERLQMPYKSVEHTLGNARKQIRHYMRHMLA